MEHDISAAGHGCYSLSLREVTCWTNSQIMSVFIYSRALEIPYWEKVVQSTVYLWTAQMLIFSIIKKFQNYSLLVCSWRELDKDCPDSLLKGTHGCWSTYHINFELNENKSFRLGYSYYFLPEPEVWNSEILKKMAYMSLRKCLVHMRK